MMKEGEQSFIKKYLSGEAHFGFWDSISKVIGLLNTFFIVSTLTFYQYGVFQLLLSIYAIFSNFLSFGSGAVNNDILRSIGEGNESKAKRLFFEYAGLRIIAGFVLAAILTSSPNILTKWYTGDVLVFIYLLVILLLLELGYSISKSLLSFRLNFGLVASRSTIYKVAQAVLLSYFFFFRHLGVREVLISMITGSAVSLATVIWPVVKSYGKWRGVSMGKGSLLPRVFLTYGKWEILENFFAKISTNLQPWAIKLFISTEAVAIYSIASTMVSTVVGFFPNKTLGTLVP